MEEIIQYFWHIVLYYLKKGKNSTETYTQKICAVCEGSAMIDYMYQKWFANFLDTIDILAK